jgi:ParB family chromosome partitioning protein
MAKLETKTAAGFNAGKTFLSKQMRIADIIIDPEIAGIFKTSDDVKEEIRQKIKMFGYDKSQPVVVWKGPNILVDGHTRLEASREAGLDEIPTVEKDFVDREEALLYTFERQVIRRNLTSSEILTATKMIQGRALNGTGRAAEHLANRLRISQTTVYQAKAIVKEAPKEILESVQSGKMSIKAGYKAIRPNQKADRPLPGPGWDKKKMAEFKSNILTVQASLSTLSGIVTDPKCLRLLSSAQKRLEKALHNW